MSKKSLPRTVASFLPLYVAFFIASCALILSLSPGTIFAQSVVSQEEEHEGTAEVFYEDRDPGSRIVYFLRTATERLELRFASNPPALQTGDHIRARGRRTNGVLALSSGGSVQTLSSGLSNTFGAQTTILILVNFYDNATQPYTFSTAQSVAATTSNFDLENSFQQTWLTGVADPTAAADVYGWFTINQSSTVCDYNTTATLADQAATAAGANLSQYSHKVYAFPQNACTWWGLGTVGGNPSQAWINGGFQLKVLGHEMGHNFGLYHSHALDCGSTVLGSACTAIEYGDTLDIMGNPSADHFETFQKERLGWLNYNDGVHVMPPIIPVQADGVYNIGPYEAQTSDPKALKILESVDPTTGNTTYYYVEYRQAAGFDGSLSTNSNVLNGVVVHLGSPSNGNSSDLLDMTPSTSSWSDPALDVGQSYSDPNAGVAMTVLSVSSAGASVSVTFSGSTSCVRANPTVALSPTTQSITAGNSANDTVTVTNNDSSACTASSFNLAAAVPSGWTASLGGSTLTISPGATGSTTLQVTSPSTATGGSYNVSVTATNSSSSTYSGSASATISIVTCSLANPTVTLSPSSQSVAVGSPASYTVTVTNNNNSNCTASSFALSAAMPSGLTASFTSSSLSIASGGSASTTLQVGSSSTLSGGNYNFTVTAANSAAPSYSGSTSALEALIASVSVTVTTEKSVYSRGQSVTIKAVVNTNGSQAANVSVSFTIKNPKNKTYTGTATTGGNGAAVYTYKIKPNDPTGTWGVTAVGSVSGVTGSGTTSFTVQ